MQRGMHVFVEKPMALNLADAQAMVQTAEQTGRVLSINLYRRIYPSLQLLKSLVESEYLGRVESVDLEGGGVYNWGAATLGNMRKESAGGGVLMDMGPHYLDQLLYLFSDEVEVAHYEDNSLGGIETDCSLKLLFHYRGSELEANVELSRSRELRNSLRVHCERGYYELGFSERFNVAIHPRELAPAKLNNGSLSNCKIAASAQPSPEPTWYDTMRAGLDAWISTICDAAPNRLSGQSALAGMKLIEQCYQQRKPLAQPWFSHPLCNASSSAAIGQAKRVLITGATGFIGCRVAEILSQRAGYSVRAIVHNPANASRLARLPVEMLQGDLADKSFLAKALVGCDAVVHCAIGTTYGDEKQIRRITVGGTNHLVQACLNAKQIPRLVHLSTIGFYDRNLSGTIDETIPPAPRKDDWYGQTKLAAEQLVSAEAKNGLQSFVLRPGCVYGPFGMTFVTRPLTYLKSDRLVLQNSSGTPSNTIYVDNLVELVVRCLEFDGDIGCEVFTVADDDGTTWGDFYAFFANALGLKLRHETSDAVNGAANGAGEGMIRGTMQLFTSPEFKEFAKRALDTPGVGAMPRMLIEKVPGVKTGLRRAMGSDRPVIYRRSAATSDDVMRITAMQGSVSSRKARAMLGYVPPFDRESALQRTLDWALYSRIV
jgi:nucleoside-diphosphate-sugar epimerase/predicted dehydrogenase